MILHVLHQVLTVSLVPSAALSENASADLLDPILPNAREKLQAVDEAAGPPKVQMMAQFYVEHHHHHANYYRRYATSILTGSPFLISTPKRKPHPLFHG
jgi:hypothetical protein